MVTLSPIRQSEAACASAGNRQPLDYGVLHYCRDAPLAAARQLAFIVHH